jgi:diguanylate cyclase (GGDEF)-like protein
MIPPKWHDFIWHRLKPGELGFVLAVVLVATFIAWQVDVFATEGQTTTAEQMIELDESLLLGGLLAVGLLVFSARRLLEQTRETRRRIEAEQHVRKLAYQDTLTGLPNRRQFDEALKVAIASPPGAGAMHAVLFLDLNGFKQINDIYGHSLGDEILIVTAQRLIGAVREGDMVARFGGDEFAILATHLMDAEAATSIARRVIQALEAPITTGSTRHQIRTGIGIALIPKDATSIQEAIRKADVALYRAKSERHSAFRFFEEEMDRMVFDRDKLERDLRTAITSGEINITYKPSIDLRSNAIVGFEAVPSWTHPELGVIPVERFISIAEEAGLIHDLSVQLLGRACADATGWPAEIVLSIPIYPAQLADGVLKSTVFEILEESGLPPNRLEIEIAESVLVRHLESVQDVLGTLRAKGVRIALSKFGTGYSSLYHLRSFKLDKIKIDREFVETINSDAESADIVGALIGLGHGFGFTVSADGVGDLKQSTALLGGGCQQGQGPLFAQAMSSEAVADFLARHDGSDEPQSKREIVTAASMC